MVTDLRAPAGSGLRWIIRGLTAAALVADAVLHAKLAGRYDLNAMGGISQGDLFRVEAGVAGFAAALILLTAHRLAWALALVTAASAVGAVLLSRYVDIGQLGPLPDMFEPTWYAEKVGAMLAAAVGTVAAAVGLVTTRPGRSVGDR